MHSPADASRLPSRAETHGLGPMRVATPSSCRTCTDYSLPVSRRTNCSPTPFRLGARGRVARVWIMGVKLWVTAPPDLADLSRSELEALVVSLLAQVAALATVNERLTARLAEVEARLAAPPKTPDNSSTPPSRGL